MLTQDADKQLTGRLALEYCALLAICTMTLATARCMPLSSFLRPGGCSPSPTFAPPAHIVTHILRMSLAAPPCDT